MTDRSDGPPEQIICVECGGKAHLLSSPPPDEQFEEGDIIAYRCSDCLERLDLVYERWDENSHPDGWKA